MKRISKNPVALLKNCILILADRKRQRFSFTVVSCGPTKSHSMNWRFPEKNWYSYKEYYIMSAECSFYDNFYHCIIYNINLHHIILLNIIVLIKNVMLNLYKILCCLQKKIANSIFITIKDLKYKILFSIKFILKCRSCKIYLTENCLCI